jgi:hypothetical protein
MPIYNIKPPSSQSDEPVNIPVGKKRVRGRLARRSMDVSGVNVLSGFDPGSTDRRQYRFGGASGLRLAFSVVGAAPCGRGAGIVHLRGGQADNLAALWTGAGFVGKRSTQDSAHGEIVQVRHSLFVQSQLSVKSFFTHCLSSLIFATLPYYFLRRKFQWEESHISNYVTFVIYKNILPLIFS